MELTRFLTNEWRRRSVLSVIRTAVTVSEAASASHYMLSSTFTGYITFIVAIWKFFLLFNTLGQNLKLSAYAQDIYKSRLYWLDGK